MNKKRWIEPERIYCPWARSTMSGTCERDKCRFWSKESKDCRWNLWLKLQILKT